MNKLLFWIFVIGLCAEVLAQVFGTGPVGPTWFYWWLGLVALRCMWLDGYEAGKSGVFDPPSESATRPYR